MREPVLIVGAGPAGLATAGMLSREGIASRILEAGPGVGTSWARYYDTLTLHTGRRISGLPGFPLPRDYPMFVPRASFLTYLRAYARHFNLNISPNQAVQRATYADGMWRVETDDRVWEAPVLVAASGISSKPYTPPLPGLDHYTGRVLHAHDYRRAAPFAGQRVLVVGMGNSATEIARDLARVAQVTIAVRSGITAVPRRTFGIPISYLAVGISRLPPGAQRVVRTVAGRRVRRMLRDLGLPLGPADLFPVIGLEIFDAIRNGQVVVVGGIAGFQPDAVEFLDGSVARYDTVILATGYRAALDYLAGIMEPPDDKKTRLDIRAVPTVPNLYFVGLWYDNLLGTLYMIGRQSQAVARAIHTSRATHLPDSWFTPLTPADEPSE